MDSLPRVPACSYFLLFGVFVQEVMDNHRKSMRVFDIFLDRSNCSRNIQKLKVVTDARPPVFYHIDTTEDDKRAREACKKICGYFEAQYKQKSYNSRVLRCLVLCGFFEAMGVVISVFYKSLRGRNIGALSLGATVLVGIFFSVLKDRKVRSKLECEENIQQIEAAIKTSYKSVNIDPPYSSLGPYPSDADTIPREDFLGVLNEGGLQWIRHSSTQDIYWRFCKDLSLESPRWRWAHRAFQHN